MTEEETRKCAGTKKVPGCGKVKLLNEDNFPVSGKSRGKFYFAHVCWNVKLNINGLNMQPATVTLKLASLTH